MQYPDDSKSNGDEERQLLDRARSGDAAAIEELFRRYRPHVARLARRSARTPEDAEDIAQHMLLEAWRSLPGFRGDSRVSTWLHTIARNVTGVFYRREREPAVPLEAAERSGTSGLQHNPIDVIQRKIEDRELASELLSALAEACSPTEQRVIRLHYRGKPLNTIAEILDMQSATVRSHLRRGRCRLLAHLILERPALFGGSEAVTCAWKSLSSAPDHADRPDPSEIASWEAGRGASFCGAVFKLARALNINFSPA